MIFYGSFNLLVAVLLPLGFSFACYFRGDSFSVSLPAFLVALGGFALVAVKGSYQTRVLHEGALGSPIALIELLTMPVVALATALIATAAPHPAVLWTMLVGRLVAGVVVDLKSDAFAALGIGGVASASASVSVSHSGVGESAGGSDGSCGNL